MADAPISFPMSALQRERNRLGRQAVPCTVTERYLKLAETTTIVRNDEVIVLSVMSSHSMDGQPAEPHRLITTLYVSKADLLRALASARPKHEASLAEQ